MADNPLAKFQVEFRKFVYVISPNCFGLEHAGFLTASQSRLIRAPQDKNTCRIVGNQRIERPHNKIENFLQIERAADLFGDVEQHAQFIGRGQTLRRRLF
ncbi:MAG: hypothetical protein LC770_07550 [Acidobacteria bacterium]|nr:hypothetical protein [Acidobacteriota bacterium]